MPKVTANWPYWLEKLLGPDAPLPMVFIKSGTESQHLGDAIAPEIAIVGRSNVGKSSLINYLGGQKQLARVSQTPGRTQTLNVFRIEGLCDIIDLPGYGFAKSPREVQAHWEKSLHLFFSTRKSLVAVLFLWDVRRDPSPEDLSLLKWLQSQGLEVVLVFTKCDKLTKSQLRLRMPQLCKELGLGAEGAVATSVMGKWGRQALRAAFVGLLGPHFEDGSAPTVTGGLR